MTMVHAQPDSRNRLLVSLAAVDFALLSLHLKDVYFDAGHPATGSK